MRPAAPTLRRAPLATATPVPAAPGLAGAAAVEPVERFRMTASFLGLAIYLWVIHSYKAPIGSFAIGLGLIGLFIQPQRLRLPAPVIWFGAFILWAAITAPMAYRPEITQDTLTNFTKLWLIFLVACNVAHTRKQFYVLVITWLGLYALYPVRGTFFNFLIGHQYWGRYAWNFTFENPNDLAAITLPIFAMSVALLQGHREKGWIRFCALAGVGALPFLILLTQSRGGILALGTMGLLILVQYRRNVRGLAIGVLLLGAAALAAPPEVWDRLSRLSNATDTANLSAVDEEGSAEQRFQIWRVAGDIIEDHPVGGIGLGGYAIAHGDYARGTEYERTSRGRRDAHSLYITVTAETGFVGLFLLLGMLGSIILRARKVARQIAKSDPVASQQLRTLLVGLIGFLQAGIFASLHSVAFLYLYLGVLATAIHVFTRSVDPVPAAQAPRRGLYVPLPGSRQRTPAGLGLPGVS